jgi:hypothetical protein
MSGGGEGGRTWVQWIRDHLALAVLAAILLQLWEGWYFGNDIDHRLTRVEVELEHLQETLGPAHK